MAAFGACSIAWLDPYARAREGNRLFVAGKYDEAAAKYNEALVDDPDSPALHFNQGLAAYKQGKYDDALKAFQQVPTSDDDRIRTARVAYSIGNAKYKLGEAAESSDPKAALTSYAEALAVYRRALGATPDDADIKLNYEFVDKKLADLKKKLEEQQKQKEEQQQQNQDQNQKQDQQKQQQNQEEQKEQQNEGEQQQQQQQQQQQPQPDQQPAQQQDQPEQQQQAAGGTGEPGEKKDGEMSQQEAAAVLDSQRDQEVSPDEVVKKLHGAVVAEPAQDW